MHIGLAALDLLLDHAMLLSLVILIVGGIAIYLFKEVLGEESRRAGLISSILVSISTILIFTEFIDVFAGMWPLEMYNWIPSLGVQFGLYMDGVSYPIILTVALLGLLATIYSYGYMQHGQSKPSYFANLLLFIGGMEGAVLATNLIAFYIFWEIMLVPSFFLILFWGKKENARMISMKYFLYTHLGALSVLIGFGLIYAATGQFDMLFLGSSAGQALIAGIFTSNPSIIKLIFVLLVAGFAVKMAIFPIHTWLPDAHSEAPTPISVLLSGVLVETGAYAIIRFGATFFGGGLATFSSALAILGVITMFYGGLMALIQTDIKRLLAYSTISQMGYIFFGIGAVTVFGLGGAMFQIINQALAKGLLFMVAGAVTFATNTRNLGELGGLSSRMPFTATVAMIGVLSIAGSPPLGGFVSEWMILKGGFDNFALTGSSLYFILGILGVVASIISAGYMLRFMWKVFLGPLPQKWRGAKEPPTSMLSPMLALAALLIVFGIFPSLALQVIGPTAIGIAGIA
nr:NADH-quinone oxidoreductase subunit M [Candidatus Njordarchaeota archaeon]